MPAPIDEEPVTEFYVSADTDGGDDSNPGTLEKPFATLARAAQAVNDAEGSSYTVYVMTDLTSTACARFYNKNVTLTSYGGTHTVSRGEDFAPISDDARSFYNPAMIEIQGYGDGKPGLTLSNIILDDFGRYKGNVFAQASSEPGHGDNLVYVQDAIVASNAAANTTCVINIASDAVLANYGGMSAVRVTSNAVVNMNGTITGHTMPAGKGPCGFGPAGAVWVQSASANVNGLITNMVGRAVYVDGGSATINGTISNVTPNGNMWWGADGTAAHIRNGGSLTLNGTVDGGGKGTAFLIVQKNGSFTMNSGAVIQNVNTGVSIHDTDATSKVTILDGAVIKGISGNGIYAESGVIQMDGMITDVRGSHAMQIGGSQKTTIGATGRVVNNHIGYGAVYGQGGEIYIYGRIDNNYSTDRGGGVAVTNHGVCDVYMYDGASISNNYSAETGGGIMVSKGTFRMYGGTIANNVASDQGGGVYIRQMGRFIMTGGSITDNATAKYGGAIAYDPSDAVCYVELQNGVISGNTMNAEVTPDPAALSASAANGQNNDLSIGSSGSGTPSGLYAKISPEMKVSREVYMTVNGKTVTITDDTKLGNAGEAGIKAINSAANTKGWASAYTTFWYQNGESVDVTVTKAVPNAALPVYVVAIPTDAKGAPVTGAVPEVCIAAVSGNNVSFALPNGNANGYAVGLVQPTQDFGALTATATDTIQKIHGGSGKYISNWGLDYSISENLANVIEQADGKDANLSLTVNLDSRLGNPDNIALESNIFEIDGEPAIDADANTVTVNLKLKSGWKDKLAAATCALSGTAELNDTDDALAYIMNTSGYVSGNVGSIIVSVPSDVAHTRVLTVKSVTLHFDANGGSNPPADMTQYIGALGTSTFTIPAAAPTNNGILFEGWSLTRNGAPAYGAGHAATIAIADDTTLYAVWHTHVFGDWLSDANNHWRECPYDGAVANLGPHTYGPWTVTVEPTTTAPGVQQRVCTVCGHAQQAALAQIPVINPVPGVPAPIAPLNPTDIDEPETPLAEEPAEQLPDEETPLSSEHGIGCIIHWILLAAALVVLVVYIITAENEKKKIKKLKEQLGL